jgi:MerR family transcriptional regulator, light-induced transcriptional regulator
VYTIKQAAQLTGVSSSTLRAWERRYPLPAPHRSSSGYRLYDDVALIRLRVMQRLVQAGWAPRNAAAVALDGAHESDDLPEPRDFVVAVEAGLPPSRREAVLTALFHSCPLPDLIESWLMPMLRELGEAWRSGRVTIWQEHAVATAVLRRLHAAFEALPSLDGPLILTGIPDGSHHELGLAAFDVLAKRTAFEVAYLGPGLPSDGWVQASAAQTPAAVVIAVPTLQDVPAARKTLAALAAMPQAPLLTAGGSQQDAVADLALPLGHSLNGGVERLVGLLVRRQQSR